VADGAQSCVLEQVTNGIAVRMALLFLLMSSATEGGEIPVADAALDGPTNAPEKKESTHAAD
jgi:hypothetical protein